MLPRILDKSSLQVKGRILELSVRTNLSKSSLARQKDQADNTNSHQDIADFDHR